MADIDVLKNGKHSITDIPEELIETIYLHFIKQKIEFIALYSSEKTDFIKAKCLLEIDKNYLEIVPIHNSLSYEFAEQYSLKGMYDSIVTIPSKGKIIFPNDMTVLINDNFMFNIVSIVLKAKLFHVHTEEKLYKDISEYDLKNNNDNNDFLYKDYRTYRVNVKELGFSGEIEAESDEEFIDFGLKTDDKKIDDEETFWKGENIYLTFTCWKRGMRSSYYMGVVYIGYNETNRKIYIGMRYDFECDGHELSFDSSDNFYATLNYLAKLHLAYRKKSDKSNSTNDNKNEENVSSTSALESLNNLVGLDNIKLEVQNLVNLTQMQLQREKQGLKTVPVSQHLVFSGNPGTGKTTVARILAQLYKEIGVLSSGHLVEVDRSGLVAGYVGQTAIKTQEKIDEAIGGVLFIDEAYTLVKEQSNDFGQEAIDTLLKAMEDNRRNLIVIVAGYTNEMNKFIESNPGLKSRFNKYIEFPDYSLCELEQIFTNMCKQYDYILTEDAIEIMHNKFETIVLNKTKNFANAREVRNYFENVITRQASRVSNLGSVNKELMMTITSDDM